MKKIRLLLIEDNRLLREGMASMMKDQPDVKIVGASGNLENVARRAKKLQPGVVVLSLNSQDHNRLRSLKTLKKQCRNPS